MREVISLKIFILKKYWFSSSLSRLVCAFFWVLNRNNFSVNFTEFISSCSEQKRIKFCRQGTSH
jgi:hypothetical protein